MEFACKEVHRVLSDHGITLLLSVPYAPEQNEVSECENHMVLELA
jgi:transposase InsO family protein